MSAGIGWIGTVDEVRAEIGLPNGEDLIEPGTAESWRPAMRRQIARIIWRYRHATRAGLHHPGVIDRNIDLRACAKRPGAGVQQWQTVFGGLHASKQPLDLRGHVGRPESRLNTAQE